MAVNSTQLGGGGKVGEVQRKRTLIDKAKANPKKYGIITAVILVAGIFVIWSWGAYRGVQNQEEKKVSTQSVCSSITKEIGPLLIVGKTAELKPKTEDILKMKNYDKDPNCLIPLVLFNVYTENRDQAEQYFAKLQELDTTSFKVSSDYAQAGIYSLWDTEVHLRGLRARQDEAEQTKRNLLMNEDYGNARQKQD